MADAKELIERRQLIIEVKNHSSFNQKKKRGEES